MLHLFVGDIFEQLAIEARKIDNNAYLIDYTNYQDASGVAYTCIADIGSLENFLEVCNKAGKITYCPPDYWSDTDKCGYSEQKYYTEAILHYINQFISVDNIPETKRSFLNNSFLRDTRKTNGQQIWAVGNCLSRRGWGVTKEQTWKEIVSKKFNLPYSDLTRDNTGITWACNQIILSDIRQGDIVFWQLAQHCRFDYVRKKKPRPATVLNYKRLGLDKFIDEKWFDTDTFYYNEVLAVRKVYNFCTKIGAKLVIIDSTTHDHDSTYVSYKVPCFKKLLVWPMTIPDRGTDGIHPGPLTHKKMAEEFLEFYSELYQNNKKG